MIDGALQLLCCRRVTVRMHSTISMSHPYITHSLNSLLLLLFHLEGENGFECRDILPAKNVAGHEPTTWEVGHGKAFKDLRCDRC
jgi:hypothetical protein